MTELARVGEPTPLGKLTLVPLHGEIDLANVAQIARRLREILAQGANGLVLDLGHLNYLDSAGLRMLFELDEDLRQRAYPLWLVAREGTSLRRVLEIAEVGGRIPVFSSIDEAIARLEGRG